MAWACGFDTLYKFKGYRNDHRDHVIDILENSRVYFSEPDQFNDPFDVAPVMKLGGDPNDPDFIKELEADQVRILKGRGKTQQEIDRLRRERGVDSLILPSETRELLTKELRTASRFFCVSSQLYHPLQWAHYADCHRGVCLHFDCAEGSVFGLARRVAYRTEREPILMPLNLQAGGEIMERLVLVKADFWSYESEFRIIAAEGVDWGATLDGSYLNFEPNLLTAITVGMWMQDDQRAELFEILDRYRPGLPVWEAVEDKDRFWMKVKQVQ